MYTKKDNFGIYILIVHISFSVALRNIKFLVAVGDIHIKGTVSQNFDIIMLNFLFYVKKRVTF